MSKGSSGHKPNKAAVRNRAMYVAQNRKAVNKAKKQRKHERGLEKKAIRKARKEAEFQAERDKYLATEVQANETE